MKQDICRPVRSACIPVRPEAAGEPDQALGANNRRQKQDGEDGYEAQEEDIVAELAMTTFLSLDGVMQAPGGPGEDESGSFPYGGWLVPHADADMGKTMVEIFTKADVFFLGRTTYDIFTAYWPRTSDPNDLIATKLNSLPKFVASRTRSAFDWNNTTLVQTKLPPRGAGPWQLRARPDADRERPCG